MPKHTWCRVSFIKKICVCSFHDDEYAICVKWNSMHLSLFLFYSTRKIHWFQLLFLFSINLFKIFQIFSLHFHWMDSFHPHKVNCLLERILLFSAWRIPHATLIPDRFLALFDVQWLFTAYGPLFIEWTSKRMHWMNQCAAKLFENTAK